MRIGHAHDALRRLLKGFEDRTHTHTHDTARRLLHWFEDRTHTHTILRDGCCTGLNIGHTHTNTMVRDGCCIGMRTKKKYPCKKQWPCTIRGGHTALWKTVPKKRYPYKNGGRVQFEVVIRRCAKPYKKKGTHTKTVAVCNSRWSCIQNCTSTP